MLLNKLSQLKKFKLLAKVALGFLLLVVVSAPVASVFGTPVVAVAHAQAQATTTQTTPANGQQIGDCNSLSTCIASVVYIFAVSLPSNIAYITGYIFNFGVQLALNSASYGLNFLSQGWAIVRDIANLSFIFILIYIAYSIIIEAETSGTMTMLAWVIAMALIINFSFFITRVVVDAGNILAVQFYNAIYIKDPSNPSAASPVMQSPIGGTLNQPAVKDLTAGIMNALQVQNLLGSPSFQNFLNRNNGQGSPGTFLVNLGVEVLIFVAVGIFLMIIAFIFLMMGVKFLIRIIILWFAIIASPLAFAAHALPNNKQVMGYYKLWEKHLVESSLYPAVFLFLFFIITQFMNALAGKNGIIPAAFDNGSGGTSVLDSGAVPGFVSIIANVGIRIGLISLLLYYAMQFSDRFSEESSSAARSVVSWAGNKTAGTVGWAARNTAGRGAYAAARSERVQNWAANSVFGRPVMASLKGLEKSSLDFRGAPGLRSVAKQGGINLDNAPKTSYGKKVDDRAKNVAARAKEIGADDAARKKYAKDNPDKYYDAQHGDGAYKLKMAELEKIKEANASAANSTPADHSAEIARLEKEKVEAEKRKESTKVGPAWAEANTTAENAAKEIKRLQDLQKASKAGNDAAKKAIADADKQMKDLPNFGMKKIAELSDDRKKRFYKRLEEKNAANFGWVPVVGGPSRGTLEGVQKARGGSKTEEEEALEHFKHAVLKGAGVGHGHGDKKEGDDEHDPDDHGGGSGKGKKTASKDASDHGHDKKSGGGDHSHDHTSSNGQQIEASMSPEERKKFAREVAVQVEAIRGNNTRGIIEPHNVTTPKPSNDDNKPPTELAA
jgi:hypothetical protein